MISTVSFYDFSGWFFKSDNYKNSFSYEGLRALFDYLEDFEDSTMEQMEFDPISICCDFTEYDSLEDLQAEYSDIKSLEELQDNTTVIECSNGHIIIQAF